MDQSVLIRSCASTFSSFWAATVHRSSKTVRHLRASLGHGVRIDVELLLGRRCVLIVQDIRHLRASLGHGPERVGKLIHLEVQLLWAAAVHRSSKTSGFCVRVLTMDLSVLGS